MTFYDNKNGKMQQLGGGGNLNKGVRISLFFLFFSFLGSLSLSATTYEWGGEVGSWDTSSNWSPEGTPANNDTATISSGKVTTPTRVLTNFTLNLEGGELEMNGLDFTLYSNSHVTQTGGTFSLTENLAWLNIGETAGTSSSYEISGGKLDLTSGTTSHLVVGRRGEGHLTVSGEAIIDAQQFMLGWSTQLSRNSSVTLNGGTLNVSELSRIGGTSGSDQRYSQPGTNTFTIDGGTYNSQGEVQIGNYHRRSETSNIAVNTRFDLKSGTWSANGIVKIGTGNITEEGDSNQVVVSISGGKATFKNEVYLGYGSGANATMNLSGGVVDFQKKLVVGTGSLATMDVSGGEITYGELVEIGVGEDAIGNFNISSGTEIEFTKHVNVGKNGGMGNLNISGKAKISSLDIGVGANSTGNFNISSGTEIEFTQQIDIGIDGGTGHLNISGGKTNFNLLGTTINIGNANSTGTLTISGNDTTVQFKGNDIHVGYFGQGTIIQTGGTFTLSQGWLNIGEHGKGTYELSGGILDTTGCNLVIGRRGEGKMTVSGNAELKALNIIVGFFPNLSGNSSFVIKGGKVSGAQLFVGNQGTNPSGAPTGDSTMTIEGGEATFTGTSYIGHSGIDRLGGNGVLNVTGGSLSFQSPVNIGYNAQSQGTVLITGGTLYAPNADFILGNVNSLAKMTIDGGTYNQNGKGNLAIHSTTVNGDVGSLLELKSGTLDTLWLSLGQNGVTDGTCTFNMTGGTLAVGTGAFRVGHHYHGKANIYGGTITVVGELRIASLDNGGCLNVYGSNSTWDVGSIVWQPTGTANFIGGELLFDSDGNARPAVSTIVASKGSATVDGHVGVDMSSYYYTGAGFMNELPSQMILTASSISWNPQSVTTEGDWILSVNNNTAELTLDESKIATADVTSGLGVAAGILGTRGWVQISGEANSPYSLLLFYGGEGDGDLLAEWLTAQLNERQQDITVTNTGSFIEFSNLLMDADGVGYLSYNIDDFNALHDMSLSFTNLPEPSTWGLMLLGLILLFWKRGSRRGK